MLLSDLDCKRIILVVAEMGCQQSSVGATLLALSVEGDAGLELGVSDGASEKLLMDSRFILKVGIQ